MSIPDTYTYLLLNIGTILFPFLLSFDRKVAFFKRWKALFPAIAVTGAVFIIWDVFFTKWGIWEFNPQYLLGIYFWDLPLEEWLFFLTVPYACVFIYDCLIAYFPELTLTKLGRPLTLALILGLSLTGLWQADHLYTLVTFLLTAMWLLLVNQAGKSPYMGRFYLTYVIHLIPFLTINGVLTSRPVVIYNNLENLGIRLGTIPLEDTIYSLLLLIMNISLYEYFQNRFAKNEAQRPQPYVQPQG